jgi:glycerol-3-phosphate dehydrogenase
LGEGESYLANPDDTALNDIIPLERHPDKLRNEEFDLLITGAGIFGACAAWEAALRGYKTAIIDQQDFGSGVSANGFKFVHGGIRYIQHLDFVRVRSSCRERSALLRIAPHLVHPRPIAIPTYGRGMSGKLILAAGAYLYDLVTADRNKGITDAAGRIPWTRLIGKDEMLSRFPGLEARSLTGGVLFSDAQLYNPPRLVLAFLQSAAAKGVTCCNYLQTTAFRKSGKSVAAAEVRDELTGESFEIRAKAFLNMAGPWTDDLIRQDQESGQANLGKYSRDACFLVPRRFDHEMALAVMGRTKDPDAFLRRPARHLFVVPWRDYSLIGVWHKVVPPVPDHIGIDKQEIEAFIAEIQETFPNLKLSSEQVRMCNWGLVPFGENENGGEDLSYGKRSVLIEHAKCGGPENMVSLTGIRFTMGRGDAGWAMKAIARIFGDDRPAPPTHEIPLYGGNIDDIEALIARLQDLLPNNVGDEVAYSLARNYGSLAPSLVSNAKNEELVQLEQSHVLEAEISHAIKMEMAQNLGDIVFRRTDLASGGSPGVAALQRSAEILKAHLKVSQADLDEQLENIGKRIPGWH